jgi:aldose 1-epimerase
MNQSLSLSESSFGMIEDDAVYFFKLSNGTIEVGLTNYGCTIVSIVTPDKSGQLQNIVAGFDNLYQYTQDHPYFGNVIGRYANRIAKGEFFIDGELFQLELNDGINHLHGGVEGFSRKVWQIESLIRQNDHVGVVFSYTSPDGEEGYPGNLRVTVSYLLFANNSLNIRYHAITDRPTIISLTNHSYFNLSGFNADTIYNHYLQVNASSYTVKNEKNTPSGVIASIEHTPLDFSKPELIGKCIHELKEDKGYDHNFVLKNNHKEVSIAAHLFDLETGRSLKVLTNQPGLQVYTANWWDGKLIGSQNKKYKQHSAIALETQSFPDSPNHDHFPSSVLRPSMVYEKETIFLFETINQSLK